MTKDKKYEKIRAIAKTVNGDRFAVAEWEKYVQVWDIEKGLISKIETDFTSGMTPAISISSDGKHLLIAGYANKSVTLYDTDKGITIWKRKDIKKPSKAIILNHYPDLVYIHTEKQGAIFLDRNTGASLEQLKGIAYIRENPYSSLDQFEKSSISSIINRTDRKTIKSFNHKSFALLDACFSSDKIFCAYSTNPLEAISLQSVQTVWTTRVAGHFLKIEYSNELDKLIGVRWEYENGSPKYLCYINAETGAVEKEINLGEPIEAAFLKQGSKVLTSQGKVYSTVSGQLVKQFDFENN